ncbi:hypothetical protein SALBM135S_07287 [Streptomyces alboniger]
MRENIRPTSARSKPSATPPTSIVDRASRSATTRCDCEGLTHQAARPESEPSADPRVGLDHRARTFSTAKLAWPVSSSTARTSSRVSASSLAATSR